MEAGEAGHWRASVSRSGKVPSILLKLIRGGDGKQIKPEAPSAPAKIRLASPPGNFAGGNGRIFGY